MENTAHTGASSRKERLGRMGIPPSKLPQMRPNLGHKKEGCATTGNLPAAVQSSNLARGAY